MPKEKSAKDKIQEVNTKSMPPNWDMFTLTPRFQKKEEDSLEQLEVIVPNAYPNYSQTINPNKHQNRILHTQFTL